MGYKCRNLVANQRVDAFSPAPCWADISSTLLRGFSRPFSEKARTGTLLSSCCCCCSSSPSGGDNLECEGSTSTSSNSPFSLKTKKKITVSDLMTSQAVWLLYIMAVDCTSGQDGSVLWCWGLGWDLVGLSCRYYCVLVSQLLLTQQERSGSLMVKENQSGVRNNNCRGYVLTTI